MPEQTPESAAMRTRRLAARTPKDYAIEFGGYMATTAEHVLDLINKLHEAEQSEDQDLIDPAQVALGEAMSGLRSDIYEFRKRADRAAEQVTEIPRVLIRQVDGGAIETISSTGPIDVAIVDFTGEGCKPHELVPVPDGSGGTSPASLEFVSVEHNPALVAEVFALAPAAGSQPDDETTGGPTP